MNISKINWAVVSSSLFTEFVDQNTEALARAYVTEANKKQPNSARLIGIWELGQARFSERLNTRERREQLFVITISRLTATN